MAMFKAAATEQLKLLMVAFLLGNSYRMLIRASPANACGKELYLRVDLGHDFLALATFTAGMLLLSVQMALDAAEANAVAAARAAARARGKAFDAEDEAADAALKGLGCIAAAWKRRLLRAMLLLAVGISLAASLLAVMVFEDGYLYRTGCPTVDGQIGATSPVALALMALMVLVHGAFAWAAVSRD
jgi:hypothetical protein